MRFERRTKLNLQLGNYLPTPTLFAEPASCFAYPLQQGLGIVLLKFERVELLAICNFLTSIRAERQRVSSPIPSA